jgi:aromatic-L-amino-acid decarboxylase
MTEEHSHHMSPDDFRRHGHAVIDWIADYMRNVDRYPVMSQVKPGEIRATLPASPPATGESLEAMLSDLNDIILPGVTHWQSPNFFGYFPCNNSGPSILGDLLSSGLGVQGMLWATSPVCTELESHVLDWMVELLDLPPRRFHLSSSGGGVFQDSASSASLCALLAARERVTNFASNRHGVDRRFTAYASTQAHSSIEKAMTIAGLGRENLRLIDAPAACGFAMNVEALDAAIRADLRAGLTPCFICATVGTTSSNAIDSVRAIGEIARQHNIWCHVDAAMSGIAAVCPEFRWIHSGLELADSYCTNPHKWMFTNFDCDCFWVADRAGLIKTLSILPEYLKNAATATGAVIDYRDWQVPLGRRFRALKLWFVIRHYGIEGLQYHIREHVRLAQQFAQWVNADDRFELVVKPPLNLVCFRLKAGDHATQRLHERLNASGRMFLTHTKLNDQYTLRMSIGQSHTRQEHVERAWALMSEEANLVHREAVRS